MKARVTIEYELDWPEGLSLQELREREEHAWMTMLQMSDLTFEVVKFELSKYPPAKPGALMSEPVKAAWRGQ
jgi:hypothetical protein